MWRPSPLIPSPPPGRRRVSLWARPRPLTLSILPPPRLPDLTTVISVDTPMPGTLLLDDVVAAGSKEQHMAELRHAQLFLSCHDPVNIQFTSVRQRSSAPEPRLAC